MINGQTLQQHLEDIVDCEWIRSIEDVSESEQWAMARELHEAIPELVYDIRDTEHAEIRRALDDGDYDGAGYLFRKGLIRVAELDKQLRAVQDNRPRFSRRTI
jgi:hypothetical protein